MVRDAEARAPSELLNHSLYVARYQVILVPTKVWEALTYCPFCSFQQIITFNAGHLMLMMPVVWHFTLFKALTGKGISMVGRAARLSSGRHWVSATAQLWHLTAV